MGKAVGSFVGSILSGVGSLFGGNQKIEMPSPEKPKVMPNPDDDAIRAAKKKSIAAIMNRSGRASTILSGDSDSGSLGV